MRYLLTIGLCLGSVARLGAQTSVHPALVSQPEGAPVALVATHTLNGRVHAAVTVRNLSAHPVATLTFVVTIGDPTTSTALRRTDTVPAALAPGAILDVTLPGISASTIARLLPSVTAPMAELAIAAVTFADGTGWRLRSLSGWLGHPGPPVTAQCLDSSNAVVPLGGTVLDAAISKQCTAGGLLLPAAGGIQ